MAAVIGDPSNARKPKVPGLATKSTLPLVREVVVSSSAVSELSGGSLDQPCTGGPDAPIAHRRLAPRVVATDPA